MTEPEHKRARYYRVSAANWPIEKYLLCDSAREAAEEFAAMFDLGDLFDQVEITVSLAGAGARRQTQQFTVRASHTRVYEAVWGQNVSEPEPEEILEFEEAEEIRDVRLEDSDDDDEEEEFGEWLQLEGSEPFSQPAPAVAEVEADEPPWHAAPEVVEIEADEPSWRAAPEIAADEADEEPTVIKLLVAANETEPPPDDEPDDSSSSGLRRFAGRATRGYGTLVKGLFGRRRGRAA
ncbi:hypothetical protein SAMN02745121_05795 [Nannocystis exedens]|uniref:Uncharacterized protein n=1 Tax=Nannocystis exedens TaxID=54 RepID=A0A1I2DYP1_9BACT|nr:hypothetical protein [Nannocystis exedens]PCC69148.1 hypothetical protein NAEX_02170 [Nannocystis exedens]SFE85507.1 hypothetical protein SAMN02745121_05795 [Nannocystis exedens]